MGLLLILAAFCGVFTILSFFGERGTYKYQASARRTCTNCGQLQLAYCSNMADNEWWEARGPIKNPKCKCHKDTK